MTHIRHFLDELVKTVPAITVRDVAMGAFTSYVETDLSLGLASTHVSHEGSRDLPWLSRHLQDGVYPDLRTLAQGIKPEGLSSVLACAALNAAGFEQNPKNLRISTLNGKELFIQKLSALKPGRAAAIGRFPFVKKIQTQHDIKIFELDPIDGDLPASQIPAELPKAELVLITGTTLINGTLDDVLSHCNPKACKLLVGPTTLMHPELLDLGLDALCGVRVRDRSRVKAQVRLGARFRDLQCVEPIVWQK